LELVKNHDVNATGFKIGINKFSDLSLEEFEKMQGFREESQLKAEMNKFLDDDDDEVFEEPQPE